MVPSLPTEITDRIVDFIDTDSCLELTLVSRQWVHRCRVRSFVFFLISGNNGRNGVPYETVLSDHGTIAPHVKSLYITTGDILPEKTWRALTTSVESGRFCLLQSLNLHNADLGADPGALSFALALCPQLRDLLAVTTKFDSVLDLAKMISASVSLEKLTLAGISCVRPESIPSHYPIPEALKLLRLGVSDINTNAITPWFQAQAALLRIHTLELFQLDEIDAVVLSSHLGILALLGQRLECLVVDLSTGEYACNTFSHN